MTVSCSDYFPISTSVLPSIRCTPVLISPAPRPVVWISDYQTYDVQGIDAIWHNIYCGDKSDFTTRRTTFDRDINWAVQKVAGHVATGLYRIINMTASEHQLVVVCICEKNEEDLPNDTFQDFDQDTDKPLAASPN